MSNNNEKKIKSIFIGTADFGLPSLRAIAHDPLFLLNCVITQPDKKAGRHQLLKPSPINLESQEMGLPVLQPINIADGQEEILKINPDLIIVAAYAQIMPEAILSIPRFGCINLHASLLPKCRGAACIQGAILNGDDKTGVTIMKMDKGLDTGPILAQAAIPIEKNDNAGILSGKLAALAAELLIPTLKKYIAGEIIPIAQNENNKSYFKILKKQDGGIVWIKPAIFIERFIRAMTPWPGAFGHIEHDNVMLKIIEIETLPRKINKKKPGTLFVHNDELLVQCGQDALAIKKLQPAGKNIITAADFIRGYKNYIGQILK